jgi:hypothetical protein
MARQLLRGEEGRPPLSSNLTKAHEWANEGQTSKTALGREMKLVSEIEAG